MSARESFEAFLRRTAADSFTHHDLQLLGCFRANGGFGEDRFIRIEHDTIVISHRIYQYWLQYSATVNYRSGEQRRVYWAQRVFAGVTGSGFYHLPVNFGVECRFAFR